MLLNTSDSQKFRYFITEPHNVIKYSLNLDWAHISAMSTTYTTLIEAHLKRIQLQSKSSNIEQICRNHVTALRAFLKTAGKSDSAPIGAEMQAEYEATLNKHISTASLSKRSASDRIGLLGAWRLTFELMAVAPDTPVRWRERRSASVSELEANKFEAALRAGLKNVGLTPKSAARKAGIALSAVGRWSRGALPNARSLPSLTKLEPVLALPPNSLTNLLKEMLSSEKYTNTIESRSRVSASTQLPFIMKEGGISELLFAEWQELFSYKTAMRTGNIKRNSKGRWAMANAKVCSEKPTKMNSKNGQVSATAGMTWRAFSGYLGFLSLAENLGGCGLPAETCQTLAWLAVPERVEAYLMFMAERSAGLKHGGHRFFCSCVASLTHEKTGYLRQMEAFASKLPDEVLKGRTWSELCDEAYEVALGWKRESTDKSRDPAEPLRYFFELPAPLTPIFNTMKKLRAEAEAAPRGSKLEATARRDELILGILVSNPLRVKNLITMTYQTGGAVGMYQTSSGNWRIKIAGNEFKNQKRVKAQNYDVPVATWLQQLVTDYINEFRQKLVGENRDNGYLFVSSAKGRRFDALSRQVFKVTKRYIPQCGGISPQAFRHLVATDWLTQNPNDFFTVAELLNDTIAVVMKNYAHLKKETSFTRYNDYILKVMPSR